jgi:hypothetical protein
MQHVLEYHITVNIPWNHNCYGMHVEQPLIEALIEVVYSNWDRQ